MRRKSIVRWRTQRITGNTYRYGGVTQRGPNSIIGKGMVPTGLSIFLCPKPPLTTIGEAPNLRRSRCPEIQLKTEASKNEMTYHVSKTPFVCPLNTTHAVFPALVGLGAANGGPCKASFPALATTLFSASRCLTRT